jgi:hypothetical protein
MKLLAYLNPKDRAIIEKVVLMDYGLKNLWFFNLGRKA